MNTKRDMVDVTIGWTLTGCIFILLVVAAVSAPLLYIWVVGVVGCLGILGVTVTVAGSLIGNGSFFDAMIGMQILRGGFELIGVILLALANVNE